MNRPPFGAKLRTADAEQSRPLDQGVLLSRARSLIIPLDEWPSHLIVKADGTLELLIGITVVAALVLE